MIELLVAGTLLSTEPQYEIYHNSLKMHQHTQLQLSEDERERIWDEIHFCIKKMYIHMNRAHDYSTRIADVSIREATKDRKDV